MNITVKKLLFSLLFVSCLIAGAQTKSERKLVLKASSSNKIERLRSFLVSQKKHSVEEIENFLQNNFDFRQKSLNDGELKVLDRIDKFGHPVFLVPDNYNGGLTIGTDHLYQGGSLGLNIEGQNMTALIWDGGYSRRTHNDFSGRVEYGELGSSLSDHATHVGGTMIGEGNSILLLRGMAPKGSLISYSFDDDFSEMFSAANEGFIVSNHSYGREVTQGTDVAVFGKYDSSALSFDIICETYPYFLPVVSAGNDRGKGLNPRDGGYDLLTDRTLSKNVLTVGAVNGVLNYTGPESVEMSSFSSFGPPDDGRIKPEIVAKGVSVISLASESDTSFSTKSGTSMSAPMVSGGLMLLQQLYNQENVSFMKSSTVRGLVTLTAKEAGTSDGPDYRFGYGLLDVEAAAKLILNINTSSFIEESLIEGSQKFEQAIVTTNSDRLSVALSWTDPSGSLTGLTEDDRTPTLVNDLDLKLIDDNGMEYFPYKLDPTRPAIRATKGVNNVDNIEIIHINEPTGQYRVEITHKGELLESQAYSLIVNGAVKATASSSSEEISGLSIFPNPANEVVNITFDATTVSSKVNVQFYNTLGQMVRNESFINNGRFNQQVNISDLGSGVYFVQVSDGNLKSTRKLIIK